MNDLLDYVPIGYQSLVDDLTVTQPPIVGRWVIRVIELQPGAHDEPIICKLEHVALGTLNGHYEALSYVWGEPTKDIQITVNEQHFHVTKNLDSALRRLRYRQSERRLWVDAICINQEDLQERSVQVQRMWAIYGLASRVVIDLGEETVHSRMGMNLVKNMAALDVSDKENVLGFLQSSVNFPHRSSWRAVRDIFDRPWWRRVWIVQEVAMATDAIVLCGRSDLKWELFENAIVILTDLYFHPEGYPRDAIVGLHFPGLHLAAPYSIYTARRQHRSAEGMETTLAALMIHFRSAETSDPRDHLYGLLRLSRLTESIRPDYLQTPQEVYKEIVRTSVTGQDGLAIFSALTYSRNSLENLPSWCPDWSAPSPNNFPFFMPDFRCTSNRSVNANFDAATLTLHGVKLEVLDTVQMYRVETPLVPEEDLINFIQSFSGSHTRITSEAKAFVRIACALFSRKRFFEEFDKLTNVSERRIARLYGSWLMRRILESGSNPLIHQFSAGELADNVGTEHRLVANISYGRTIFATKNGELGIGPLGVEPDDIVVGLFGGRTPFVLRPINNDRDCTYHIIGDW